MISIFQAFLMSIGMAFLILVSVLIGGFLVFRSKAAPGEGFFRAPKGQVFTIPEAEGAPEEVDQTVVKQTEKFLELLGGKQ
jgi:predicted glycoside hydrolase/deacetylase ChbG (UPF0249 family)